MRTFLLSCLLLFSSMIYPESKKNIPLECGHKCVLTKNDQKIIIQKEIFDDSKNIIFLEKYKYDDNENLIEIRSGFLKNNCWQEQVTSFTYNKNDKVTSFIRAFGSQFERRVIYEYDNDDRLILRINPNGVRIHFNYDEKVFCHVTSSDNTIDYLLQYNDQGSLLKSEDRINGLVVTREVDNNGNIIKEVFPNNIEINVSYDDENRPLVIKEKKIGKIKYEYEEGKLLKVVRMDSFDKEMYSHSYHYNDTGEAIEEHLINNLGKISYEANQDEYVLKIKSPYTLEECFFNPSGLLLKHKKNEKEFDYEYDFYYRLINFDQYDLLNNPIDAKVNDLNELLQYKDVSCEYDLNGNVIVKNISGKIYSYDYDAFGRLIHVKSDNLDVIFAYDFYGRRLSKFVRTNDEEYEETYVYQDTNEIALYENGALKEFLIPGKSFHKDIVKAIAIEKDQKVFAPIYDIQGNIIKLIDQNKNSIEIDYIDPFGNNLENVFNNQLTSYLFSYKKYDPEINMVYFGNRYYDPTLKRWLTPDPMGLIDGVNLYSYVHNNPLRFCDPNGLSFTFALPLFTWGVKKNAFVGLAPLLPAAGAALTVASAAWTCYEVGKFISHQMDKKKTKWSENKKPPYNGKDLGKDSRKRPGKGFEWKGGEKGSWYNNNKKHSLRPDFDHPKPIKPHWDFEGPEGKVRLNLDGTWEPK